MWMYTLLPKIWNMSLTASMVILVVLFARLLLKKAPRKFAYILWAVVLFRLLCPVSFPAPFSLLQMADVPVTDSGTIEYVPPEIVHMEYPKVDLPGTLINMYVQDALPYGEEQIAADPLEAPMAMMTVVWLAGMALIAGYSIYSLLKLRQKLIGSVRYAENIRLSDSVSSPFVIGLIRPKIYLPSTLSGKELEYILFHEQTHIRRGDHIFKVLAFLALTIHWFNPLVWLAFVLSGEDMEMSCDEAVMESMDKELRADYSASLLSFATGKKIIAGTPLAFGEGDTKKRIKNILNYKRPRFWVIAVSVVILSVFLVVLAVNPMMDDNSELFGAVYQVEDELYRDIRYDSVYGGENYPEYCVTADRGLMRKETYYEDPWHDMGSLYRVEMSRQELYSLFDTLPNHVHERIDEVKNIYRADTNDDSCITHWVMTTRDGDVLIAMGYLGLSDQEDHIRYLFEVVPVSGDYSLDYFVLTIERALELENVEVFHLYESDSLDHSIITGWYTEREIGYSVFRYAREKERNDYQLLPGSTVFSRESEPMIFLSAVQLADKTYDIVLSSHPELAKIERTTDIDIASAVRHTPHMEVLSREPGWEDPYAPVYWRFCNRNDEIILEGFGEELMAKGPDVSLLDAVAEMAGTSAVEIISKTQMNTAPYYTFAGWQTADKVGFCALRDRTTPDGLAAYERIWGTSLQKDSLNASDGIHWERRGGIYDGVALNFDILISTNNELFRMEQTKNGKTVSFDVTACPAVMIFPHTEKHSGQMRYVLYGRNDEVISEFLYGDAEFDVTEEAVHPYMIVTTAVSVYASWYPDGFNFDYDKVSQLTVGSEYHGIAFSLSEPDVTELKVGVDFYDGNTIKQLSHTLTVNEEGSFIIPMPERADPGDKLICFIPFGETGKFVFKADIT